MSLYLKYRPQTVAELDQAVARRTLEKVKASGTWAHAYLFAGPKGTGKTSSARIMAKLLNCELNREAVKLHQPLQEPCGTCASCKEIQQGTSMAVMELDAASNRGIDDVRMLKERIALSPPMGMTSVYVIDEVHMLTTEAFNALLKTLEEPPAHAVFVLCTTELHKLPETVVSRCTLIQLSKATEIEIKASLDKVVKGESFKLKDGVLEAIAKRADGSFRDAMKVLEQAAQMGDLITISMIDELTGFGGGYEVAEMLGALLKRDARAFLADLHAKDVSGFDMGVVGQRLAESARELWLEEVVGEGKEAAVKAELMDACHRAAVEQKTALIVSVPLEVMGVRWCLDENTDQPRGIQAESQQVNQENFKPVNLHTSSRAGSQSADVVATKDRKQESDSGSKLARRVVVKKAASVQELGVHEQAIPVIPPLHNDMPRLEMIQARWPQILQQVKPHNHSIEALLKAARPFAVKENIMVIEVFYQFHKEQLEQERHKLIVEKVIGEVCGVECRLSFVLGNKQKPIVSDTSVDNVTGKLNDEELAAAAVEIFS